MVERAGLNSQRGGAYILTLVVMLTVFVMLAVVYHTTVRQMLASRAYRNNANLYELAVYGAEQAEDILNKCLEQAYPAISAYVLETLRSMPIEEIAVYSYLDGFHLKNPDSNGLRGETDSLFKNLFTSAASDYIEEQLLILFEGGDFLVIHNVDISGEENEDNFVVSVDISVENNEIPTVYKVLTYAHNTQTGISSMVTSELMFSEAVGSETFIERYSWKIIPPWLAAGLVMGYEDWDEVWDLSNSMESEWSEQNPVLITSVPTLDISSFYDGDEQVATVVVYTEPGSTLHITASDPAKAEFRGVILSAGAVEFNDVPMKITGTITSQENIMLDPSVVLIDHDPDALFCVKFFNSTNRRLLLDAMHLTNYKDAVHPMEYNITDLCSDYIRIHLDVIEIQSYEGGQMRFRIHRMY